MTGLVVKENVIRDTMIGIEFRGISESTISNNHIFGNQIWGIALRQSLGCLTPEPGWECFSSTANLVADNETWGNVMDLYHYEGSLGNTWERNTCETKQGVEIPACSPPSAVLTINEINGRPGSFFTLAGANFSINDIATITVSGTTHSATLGTVPTDASGDLVFLLNTSQADTGNYQITATINPSASTRFVLKSSKPLRPQAGQGIIFNVPGGLGFLMIRLPLVIR